MGEPQLKAVKARPLAENKCLLQFIGEKNWTSAVGPLPQTFKPGQTSEVDIGLRDTYLSLKDPKTRKPLFRDPAARLAAVKHEEELSNGT